jgi:4-amino-4-deoxy-L-arabinose transferase-like glycosyltransferase
MTRRLYLLAVAAAVSCAALLRLVDLEVPDLLTDEAQFLLGRSAAQPPLGMWLLRLGQLLGGHDILAGRLTAGGAGVATVAVIWKIADDAWGRREALLVACIAAAWPSHVLFSRLAYLSVFLCLGWAVLLLLFLRARRNPSGWVVFGVYLATLAVVFTKTQGLLFPGMLLLGRCVERRGRVLNDPLAWALLLGVLPFGVYLLTHPGIPATVLLYAGNRFDAGHTGGRLAELLVTWRSAMGPAVLFVGVGLVFLRRVPWPVTSLCLLAVVQGLLLDPTSMYYSTQLAFFSLPVAAGLSKMGPPLRALAPLALVATTLALYGPRDLLLNRWTHPLYRSDGYWNTHAAAINAAIGAADVVRVVGIAGHQVRWYIDAEVRLADEAGSGVTVWLDRRPDGGEVLYEDERVAVTRSSS